MKLQTTSLALAAAATAGITYVICALFTWAAPNLALKFLGWMMHLVNVEKFAGGIQMSAGGFVLGLLPILFYSYLGGWLLAWLYNRFSE